MFGPISRTAFVDEMVKIAQDQVPSLPQDKVMNKEVLKRFLLDAGAVALGTGAGYGLGVGTMDLVKSRWPHPPSWVKPLILAAAPLAGAGAGLIYATKVKGEQERRLAEAYRMGQLAKENR